MTSFTNPMSNRRGPTHGHKGRGEDLGLEARRVVGDWLAERRLARGLTQADVGKALGILHTAVSAIELGRNSLPPERFKDMADCLGVNRRQFAKHVLRHYNPWMFALLFPGEMSEEAVEMLPERLTDHRKES